MIDASALVEFLLRTEAAGPVEHAIAADHADLHVPALCDVEVVAALRRALMGELLDVERADEAMQDYLDLDITRHGHQALLVRMLSLRDNFSAYDAAYVALAEQLDATLVTADRALARAVQELLDRYVISP